MAVCKNCGEPTIITDLCEICGNPKFKTLQAENKRLREEKKDIANDYEKQIKRMRASLRRWCIANNFKLNDEGPDILIDN